MVEPNMVDMRFDGCFLLAENLLGALDWPSFPREGRRPDFLLLARLRQRCLWLAIRSGTLLRVCVPSCNSSTTCGSSSNKQQKKQAAAGSSSCKTSPADMAHAGMAACRRLTQTDLASCSLFRISTTTSRPAAHSQLQNDQGSTVTRRRSGEGQELAAYSVPMLHVLLLQLLLLLMRALLRALLQASVTLLQVTLLQASTAACRCMVLLLQARVPSALRL